MRWLMVLAVSIAVLVVGVGASPAHPTQAAGVAQGRWVIRHLGTFDYSKAVAINERGQVVGNAWVGGAGPIGAVPPSVNTAFLWHNDEITELTLGGKQSGVGYGIFGRHDRDAAINERGQVVGWAETKKGDQHAFLWENGKMRDLGTFGGKESEAIAVNDRGQVVGWAETKKGDRHAFFWENGKLADLTPGRGSEAIAINNRGQVLVSSRPDFLWEKGKTTRIGTAKDWVSPEAINGRGQVVGGMDCRTGSCAISVPSAARDRAARPKQSTTKARSSAGAKPRRSTKNTPSSGKTGRYATSVRFLSRPTGSEGARAKRSRSTSGARSSEVVTTSSTTPSSGRRER